MRDNTKVLSSFISNLKFNDLPEKTVENTRLFMIDFIAAAMAGYKVNKTFNRAVEEYVFAQDCGKNECEVLFSDKKLPCGKAAFLNACYAHGADMDDGNRKAMGHVGAHVFPTVLALAQSLGKSEKDVVVAVNVGYEVYCRVAAAAQPGLVHRGFHSTGTAGVIACAAAAAKIMNLSEDEIYNAMAISVTMASGLMIIAESGQSIKPLNPARAAESGILAATLAKEGVKGGITPLESKKGWFHAMSDSVDEDMITDGLGKIFTIDECYIKPYPSCRHTHCGMQAALELKKGNNLDADDIEKINMYIYENAIKIAGQIKVPVTADDTKFSIHYATACIIAKGSFTLNDLKCAGIDKKVLETIDKIELITDEAMENRDKGIRGCRVEIILKNGTKLERTVLIPKGDPQNAFTVSDMENKLSQCAKGILDVNEQKHLINRILNFAKENKKFERIM